MQNKDGLFIAIEGIDGAGKGTQFKLLVERLELAGFDVATFDFPRYDEPSSYFVKQYLNGAYGSRARDVSPYTASLFYALDRFAASKDIREALDGGKIVVSNRFTGSNMAGQGTKFANADERRGYFIWLDNLEFEMLHIPRPDLNLVLKVPAELAQTLVDKKDRRSYTNKKRDIHEADIEHMISNAEVYEDLCQLFPRDFVRVDCARNNKMLPIETISNLIWEKVFPFLPKPTRPKKTAKADVTAVASISTLNPFIEQTNDGLQPTDAGRTYLADVLTDPIGSIYGFNDTLSPVTVATAMARLCRRSDDLRITLLEEFTEKNVDNDSFTRRAILAYGDDSVHQMMGLHLVVEGASNLLTKRLEWGRLGAYTEQSTRYLYFDRKDKSGHYRYYVPKSFDDSTKAIYRESLDKIFDNYSVIVKRLTDYVREKTSVPKLEQDEAWENATRAQACDAARAVLPVATKSAVGMFASAQSIEDLIIRLQSDELPEAKSTGAKLLEQVREIAPAFFDRTDQPERGGADIAYRADTAGAVKKLSAQYLPTSHSLDSQNSVDLVDVWPRNELLLVPDMLYEHSNMTLREIREMVESWPYDKKAKAFQTYMGERLSRRQRPGRALEIAHYTWDIVCDYGIFRELQRHRMVDDLERQYLTPRYGYDVPELVESAGLDDLFEECFDISLRLHSMIQQAGHPVEAQYATLLGHKMRWKVMYNAREAFHIHELRTSPQAHPEARKLVQLMHDKLAEVHPLMAGAMRFVDTSEDPELTRLAAERYAQYKLRQLEGNSI